MSEQQSTSTSVSGPSIAPEELVTQNILNQISGVATQYAGALYNWGQNVFNNLHGDISGIMGHLETAAQSAMSGANTALGQFTNSFIPDYNQLRSEAQQYASPGREARNAGMAESQQMQANQSAIQQMEQKMQGYGINPSGPGYYGDLLAAKTAGAAAAAGAGTQSIRQDEQTGLALKKQALDYGIQMPGVAANFLNQANQARSIAGNLDIGTANAGTGLMQVPNAYLNTAMQNRYPPSGQSSRTNQQSSARPAQRAGGNQSGGGNQNGLGGGTGGGNNQTGGGGGGGPKTISAGPKTTAADLGNPYGVDYAELTDPEGNPWQVGTDQMTGPNGVAITDYGASPENYNAGFNYDENSYLNGPNDVPIGDAGYSSDLSGYNDAYNYAPEDTSSAMDTSNYDLSSMYTGDDGGYGGDYAGGGAIPEPTTGGAIPQSASPSMGAETDDIHAKVNADEFIMPRDVAVWKGQEFFYKLIADSRKKLAEAQASGVGGKPSAPPTGPVNFASRPMR